MWPHTGALSLPISHEGRVLGCSSVIWMARVVPGQDGVRLCLGPLREAQEIIERALASPGPEDVSKPPDPERRESGDGG